MAKVRLDKEMELLARARNLLNLVKSGFSEVTNHETFLSKIMAKHDFTEDDFTSEKVGSYVAKIDSDEPYHKLFQHICHSVSPSIETRCASECREIMSVECTKPQFAEIEIKYSVYSRSLNRFLRANVDEFFTAFLIKNKVYSHHARKAPSKDVAMDLSCAKRIMAVSPTKEPLKRVKAS